ncbi:hypothetical protein ACQV3H_29085, partial [Klebsiella pneumoniae]|uniref:hypothetical protein n=1 Tax=Klebsiella pneumoniae TaxID=573 RepID=UPI003D16B493
GRGKREGKEGKKRREEEREGKKRGEERGEGREEGRRGKRKRGKKGGGERGRKKEKKKRGRKKKGKRGKKGGGREEERRGEGGKQGIGEKAGQGGLKKRCMCLNFTAPGLDNLFPVSSILISNIFLGTFLLFGCIFVKFINYGFSLLFIEPAFMHPTQCRI